MFHPDQKSIGRDELMLIRKDLGARRSVPPIVLVVVLVLD
jgi:hypothetical protein